MSEVWSLSGVLVILYALMDPTFAAPSALKSDGSTLKSTPLNETFSGRANSRQLTNNIVPNAGTGISAGSTAVNGVNNLDALKQHLAATAGNNPLSVASELQAQAQEAMQLQKVQNQQNLLANVQAQKQQVASAQAALTTPASTVGKPFSPGNPAYTSVMNNPATKQTYAQLEAERQKLALQQHMIQQAIRPDAYQQSSMHQVLLSQLLNTGSQASPAVQPIAQQQIPVHSSLLQMNHYPSLLGTRMVGMGGMGSGTIYDTLYNPAAGSLTSMDPMLTGSSFLGSQYTQELLFQQQQQQLMLLQQQQLAMLNPYLYG